MHAMAAVKSVTHHRIAPKEYRRRDFVATVAAKAAVAKVAAAKAARSAEPTK